MKSGGDPRWRVFISHTGELDDFPRGNTYVDGVMRAISAAGHVVVDMRDFPAVDRRPAQLCIERVKSCDVYVGVLGTRYGSPVRDRPEVSYTELEFDTATEAGMDRLVFMLDTEAEGVGIPPSKLMDLEFGARQNAFRNRVKNSQLTMQSFGSAAELGWLVERSLRDLADTRRRIDSGIHREQVPAERQPVRASKFVNPAPAVAPTWFQDRQVQTGLLADWIVDPGIRLVSVVGRGGIGKTAMVCRLLKEFEAGRMPDVEGGIADISVGGIVYLSANGTHQVDYPTLVADLIRLLPADVGQRLRQLYQEQPPMKVMAALLEAFPVGDPVVVFLDNVESVMDSEREALGEDALHEALRVLLTSPAHAVTVIATTRISLTALLKVEPARQKQLWMEEGLGSPDAESVLRELDDDGTLGLRDASEAVLDGLRRHTRGFPRALEAVKAILDGDRTLTPQDLLDRTRDLPEDQVVEVLVGEAYDLLDPAAQRVMQALAVYPAPVSAVAVDFLLRPFDPTTNAAPILARLVRRQLVRFLSGHYYLHPVDREYARDQIGPGTLGDVAPAYTLTSLQALAADYYTKIRTPRESWRTLDDIQPQLAEFDLRCATGDYDTAATVLADIDVDYLQRWGHYRTLIDLHGRIRDRIADRVTDADHLDSMGSCFFRLSEYGPAVELHSQARDIYADVEDSLGIASASGNLGLCYESLGDYRRAIDLHTRALDTAREIDDLQGVGIHLNNIAGCHYLLGKYLEALDLYSDALAIAQETDDRQSEGIALGNLGNCHESLGDYRRAIDLHTQSLQIARETRDRYSEGNTLGNAGLCHYKLGEYGLAIDLHTQALDIFVEMGSREGEGIALGNLGNCYESLGDYRRAIDLHTQAVDIARDIGSRTYEARGLDFLGRAWLASGDASRAMTLLAEAVRVADSIGDIVPTVEARSSLARAYLHLNNPETALETVEAAQQWPFPTEEPKLLVLKGVALLLLERAEESAQTFRDAAQAATALLDLADRNVVALHSHALAVSGLAAATRDPVKAREADDAFRRSSAVTEASGLAAESLALFDSIVAHDTAGVLAQVRAARG